MDKTALKPATPLPWESEAPMGGIRTANGHIYAHHEHGDFKTRMDDAAYIVTACNAYPQIVAALRECIALEARLWDANHFMVRDGSYRVHNQKMGDLLRSLGEV